MRSPERVAAGITFCIGGGVIINLPCGGYGLGTVTSTTRPSGSWAFALQR